MEGHSETLTKKKKIHILKETDIYVWVFLQTHLYGISSGTYELYSEVIKSSGELLPEIHGHSGVIHAKSFLFVSF